MKRTQGYAKLKCLKDYNSKHLEKKHILNSNVIQSVKTFPRADLDLRVN